MSKNLIYVTGAFEGVFYTLQKSPISIGEKIPEGGLHHVRIFQGSLNQVAKLDHFLPEEHLNRDGMLLHNITNIQLNPGSKSVVKEKLIYDFDQVVIKDVYVENSWELNDKTYGILKGTLVGKLKN